MFPIQVKVVEQSKLILRWDDNSESTILLETLRKFCPCATCATDRESRSKSYIPIFYSSQKKINKINVIGKYALGINWEDGHNTGIYEFSFLKNLSDNK